MSLFNVANLFLDTDLADITFVVEDEDILGHRVVFASACVHFKSMLVGEEESQEKHFQVKNTSAKAFKEVKRFIYLGRLDIENWNVDDLLDLLTLAKELQLQDIFLKVIRALMKQQLDFDSWHSVKSAASVYRSRALEVKCVSFAVEKWTDFLQLKDLDKFTAEFLCCMFGCPKVYFDSFTCNQDELRSAISAWKMDRSEEELWSVVFNFKMVSKNVHFIMMEEFFSIDVNTDEVQLAYQSTPNMENPSESYLRVKRIRLSNEEEVKEPLKCIVRVDNLSLSKGVEMDLKLLDGSIGRCFVCVLFDRLITLHLKDSGRYIKGYCGPSVTRMEFEADTKFSLQIIEGYATNIRSLERPRTSYMCSSGPTSKKGWFKYRGVFSYPTPVTYLYINSPDFENISEIRLRNFVIY